MQSALEKIEILLENHDQDLGWSNGNIENWVEAWYELVYCILAGSKVHTNVVQKSYENLIHKDPEKVLFTSLILEQEDCMNYVKKTLHDSGYRFYNAKSEAVLNAAFFYTRIYNNLENHEIEEIDPHFLRAKLVTDVDGIGIKIATHWLRNIGFDFPIVDVHTRNILIQVGMIDGKFKKQSLSKAEYLFIENVLFHISKELSKPAGTIDYVLWKHGKENCKCTVL